MVLEEHDLRGISDAQDALQRIGEEEVATAFDLEQGPLIRSRLVQLDDEDHVLLVTMHHIISDGWSLGVLFNEISALYGAYLKGRENPLPPLSIQYPDHAAWQRCWLQGEGLQQQVSYWKEALCDAPTPLELPAYPGAPPMARLYRGHGKGGTG